MRKRKSKISTDHTSVSLLIISYLKKKKKRGFECFQEGLCIFKLPNLSCRLFKIFLTRSRGGGLETLQFIYTWHM